MERKVPAGSVSFTQNWVEYRDGFGSETGNDNYWLGLDKVYRLVQMGSVRLRVEVTDNELCHVQGWMKTRFFGLHLRRTLYRSIFDHFDVIGP